MGWALVAFVVGLLAGSLVTYRLAKGRWPWRGVSVDL